jgi:adenylate cyclase
LLPFANISDDPQQQYFTGGLTDDLTTDLSRFADMFVIARNTAFTYRDKPVDAKQIGRELGVRCVLEGNGQWSGNQVRINAQLLIAKLPPCLPSAYSAQNSYFWSVSQASSETRTTK